MLLIKIIKSFLKYLFLFLGAFMLKFVFVNLTTSDFIYDLRMPRLNLTLLLLVNPVIISIIMLGIFAPLLHIVGTKKILAISVLYALYHPLLLYSHREPQLGFVFVLMLLALVLTPAFAYFSNRVGQKYLVLKR